MNRVERTELREILTEEEKQRRREDVDATIATHAIEGIKLNARTLEAMEGYAEGRYDMSQIENILLNK